MKYDAGYIIRYMLEYDIGVPPAMIIEVLFFVCCVIFILFRVKISYSVFLKQASFCLLIGYIFLVFCTTIFFREETFEKRYNLRPLLSYTTLDNNLLAQLIMNSDVYPNRFFYRWSLEKKAYLECDCIRFRTVPVHRVDANYHNTWCIQCR